MRGAAVMLGLALAAAGCATPPRQAPAPRDSATTPRPQPATASTIRRLAEEQLSVARATELALATDLRIASLERAAEAARLRRAATPAWRDPELRLAYASESSTDISSTGTVGRTIEDLEIGLRIFPPNPFLGAAERNGAQAEAEWQEWRHKRAFLQRIG